MKFGLTETVIQSIQQVLEQNPRVDKALIFGSRAKGNYKEGSDIDLALKGDLTAEDLLQLYGKLEALNLPYKFDLVNYHSIDEPQLREHVDRVGVEMYSRWNVYKIEDFAEIFNHKRIPLSSMERSKRQGRYPYYGASGIIDYVDDYLFDGEHLLISEDGENLKSRQTPIAYIANGKFWVNNHAHILKGKLPFYNKLLVYYFENLDLNPYITGAVQPKLNKAALTSIPISLPRNHAEQESITNVLSSLDDKIDLLHRQNKTLEQLAETLFRQWFVEEGEESWESTSLAEHTEAFRGLSYKGSGLTEDGDGLPMHNLNSIYEFGGYKRDGIKYYKGEYRERHLVNAGDIIITNTEQGHEHRLIGFPGIVPDTYGKVGLFSQHIYRLLPLKKTFLTNQFLYYLLMSPSIREQIIGATNGSTVNMLAIDGLQRPEFKLPPKEKVLKFSTIVVDYWKKKGSNHSQIRTLMRLRDALLPKLMSGEVRVKLE